jgi:lipooligosaccharide transport system permease protein
VTMSGTGEPGGSAAGTELAGAGRSALDTAVPTAAAATLTRRPRPGSMALPALEFWLRGYRRTWRGSVVSGVLAPLLYLGSLGFGLGALVDRGASGGVGGVPYALFLAPGVLAATAMQTAVTESTWPVLGAITWQRQYHAMLAAPLGVVDVFLGHLAFVALRLVFVSTAFVAVGAALGAFRSVWVLGALLVAVLVGLAHAAPVMAYASAQESDGGFALLFRFGVMPMFLFAGTFFPIEQLPAAIRPVAWLTPLWHGTQACRALSLGEPELAPLLGHLGYLLVWVAVGVRVAAWAFRRRLVR